MTVKEFIEKLNELPDNYIVSIGYGTNIPKYTIESTAKDDNLNVVWIFPEEIRK